MKNWGQSVNYNANLVNIAHPFNRMMYSAKHPPLRKCRTLKGSWSGTLVIRESAQGSVFGVLIHE